MTPAIQALPAPKRSPATEPADITLPPYALRRFSVDEYHKMIDAGWFDDERVELLEGWIVRQMGHNPPHDVAVRLASKMLDRQLPPEQWHTRVQSAITLPHGEPRPDVAVVAGVERDYVARHPGAPDIAIAIEISDSTLPSDRAIKGPSYARAGIAVYWIINLPERVVEVYTLDPAAQPVDQYPAPKRYAPGDSVPLTVGGVVLNPIPVAELLP